MRIFFLLYTFLISARVHSQTTDSLQRHFNDTLTLKQVTVTAKKAAIQVFADKTVINVEAGVNNAGASALEILERSPGISFDKDGNLRLKGKAGVLIMIDGKPAQLAGGDLNNLLSTMNAAQLESIELIDNPSSKYDAAGSAGVINIKTKKNRTGGLNGSVNSSISQGRYNRQSHTVSVNRYSGKVNLFATASMNVNKNFSDLYAFRNYFDATETTIISKLEQPSLFVGKLFSQNIKAGLDYFISPRTTLGIVLAGTHYSRKSSGNNTAVWMDAAEQIDSTIVTVTRNREELRSGAANFNAQHRISDSQEFTADLDFLGYRIGNDQQFSNTLTSPVGYTENIRGHIPSAINIVTAKADYSQKLSNSLRFESGWKSSYVATNNKADYSNNPGTGWQPDYNRSNQFIYKENINALYASAKNTWNRFTVSAGLRFEQTTYRANQLGNVLQKDSSFSRNYGGLFPTFTMNFTADSANTFSVTAGRRIDRPPFQSLNPFVFLINKYTYQSGNPYYRPQYTWNTGFTHSFKNTLVTSVTYGTTRDYFSQIFYADSSGIITYTEGNLRNMQNIGLSVSLQGTPTNWWTFSGQVNLNRKKISGYIWKELNASLTQLGVNITNQFSFGKGWSGEISAFAQLREQELQEITEPTGQVIAGISRQALRKRGVFRLTVRDIFYTQAMEGNTIFRQATEYFKITRDSRNVTLAFSYRFGKQNANSPRRNTGGAEDEKQRVNTSS